jgi:3-isopropylmalate dehydrogenase
MYIDALCLALVRDPRPFQVIVTGNLFGDIVTDLGAALQGGLGMAASANLHPGRTSMFEPVHGSAPDIAGRDLANPVGAIASAALMLSYLGFARDAERIDAAILKAVRLKKLTSDAGGSLGTRACGEWIASQL